MTVLTLIPSTRSLAGKLKTTLGQAAGSLGTDTITLAMRDNGPKIGGTLVMLGGKVGKIGDALSARSGKNKIAYGPHLILGHVTVVDGKVGSIEADFDVTDELKAPVFTVQSESADPVVVAPTLVNVVKVKDGSVIASGVTQSAAATMIAKAKTAKRAALAVA